MLREITNINKGTLKSSIRFKNVKESKTNKGLTTTLLSCVGPRGSSYPEGICTLRLV